MIFYPELDYYYKNYWDTIGSIVTDPPNTSELTTYEPENTDSIFSLLFNNLYLHEYYVTKFKKASKSDLPKSLRERMNATVSVFDIYVSDNEGEFEFITEEIDISLLDELLNYRLGLEVNIEQYEELCITKLSRLIYIYLDILVNLNLNIYANDEIITELDDSLYLKMFEMYVINEVFRFIKSLDYSIDISYIDYKPTKEKFIIDSDDYDSIQLSDFIQLQMVLMDQ
jgi:hypothetical protein